MRGHSLQRYIQGLVLHQESDHGDSKIKSSFHQSLQMLVFNWRSVLLDDQMTNGGQKRQKYISLKKNQVL